MLIAFSLTLPLGTRSVTCAQTLEERLVAEGSATLAAAALAEGDAGRGAVVFHQAQSGCARCHTIDGGNAGVGPDLTAWPEKVADAVIVEALLEPSKRIRQGYETATIALTDGRTLVGIVKAATGDEVVFKEATGEGQELRIPRAEIAEQAANPLSVMPAGVANQLTSRGQFLDLVRYVIEIRDGGVARARELQPPASAYALRLPEYESHVDHAGMIRSLDDAALERGASIYARVCRNCHGTREEPGSLPTSLKFASGAFKNGSDPYAMYRTLTHGFGQMTPQTWMVPEQKYDVIHYLRETYLKPHNATQYRAVDEGYLASLPRGDTRGPAPTVLEPWATMDYGPSLIHTYEIGEDETNFAHKGIAVRLDAGPGGVARGAHWMVFDHDTMRVAGAWEGNGFVDWQGVQFDGQHFKHPRPVGEVVFANPTGPGWADPKTGKFEDDQRVLGRDGRRYGPLPREWARYHGLYQHHGRVVMAYSVGDAEILEMPGMERQPAGAVYTRAFQIGPRSTELRLLAATSREAEPALVRDGNRVLFGQGETALAAGISRSIPGCGWRLDNERLELVIPPGNETRRFVVWIARARDDEIPAVTLADAAPELDALTAGGPELWPERLTTTAVLGQENGPFAADVLTPPDDNPWLAQMRLTGLDFFDDGDRAAVCSWDGDVWLVSGLATLGARSGVGTNQLTWHRIASGLFQPLGLKIVDGVIHLTCRDQLVVLRDLNGDGATDFYECLNNDQQVTEHFHEFAMGLQTDAAGNFYYAKSARHALPAVVPQHGTLMRVSRDGERTEILANGFRAANGICLNDDGSFFVTDQEGHWIPKNRINWVTLDPSGKPKFFGNMFGYHDVTDPSDERMEPPLCWITNAFDRSPAELLWVPPGRWDGLGGRLLNLSYGYGKAYVVPHEKVGGLMQGGMCELPLPPFPTGIMRGRFHPRDGQLYVCGMFAWAGSAIQPGGLYRIRYTGQPMHLPVELHATRRGMSVTFTDRLDRSAAEDVVNYHVKAWSLKRSEEYGSDHYDEHELAVETATLASDGRTVMLEIPKIAPTWCMEIAYTLRSESGETFKGQIHNTVHRLAE